MLVELGRMSTEPDPLATPAFLRMAAEDPSYVRFCENKTLAFEGAAWAALAGDIATQDDRLDALRSIAVPTLVIVGEQDAGFIAQSRAMAAAIPGAELAVIPEGGHSPQFEAPSAWWATLSRFLADSIAAVPIRL